MLEQIDYKTIFHYFEEISKVPRGSYHNEKISDYLVQFAKERGIAYRQEECGNVIFRKPASADCRSGKTVMMQDIWIWFVYAKTIPMILKRKD